MRWIVGNGNEGKIQELESRIRRNEASLQRTAGIGELDLSSDGHVYGWSGDAFVPDFQVSVPVSLGQWHNLAIVADFASSSYSFFVDDQYLGTFPFPTQDCGDCYTTTLLRGSLLASAAPDNATDKKSNYTAYYDNFSIQAATSLEAK